MDWQLADAKNKFSALVSLALSEGPQRVMRRHQAVIVIAQDEYDRLTGKRPSFKEFLLQGPGLDVLDLTRDSTTMRDVEL